MDAKLVWLDTEEEDYCFCEEDYCFCDLSEIKGQAWQLANLMLGIGRADLLAAIVVDDVVAAVVLIDEMPDSSWDLPLWQTHYVTCRNFGGNGYAKWLAREAVDYIDNIILEYGMDGVAPGFHVVDETGAMQHIVESMGFRKLAGINYWAR